MAPFSRVLRAHAHAVNRLGPALGRTWGRRLILCLMMSVLLTSEGAGAVGGELSIATYNVENYTSTGRMTPEGYKSDYPKPEAAKRALHAVIRHMNADVLALQEMGSASHLEELRRDLATMGMDYPHGMVLEAEDKERRLAVLSKVPLEKVTPHTQVCFNYLGAKACSKRGLLEVNIATEAGRLTLWIVHLKSRHSSGEQDPTSAIFRAAEATALREILIERHKPPSADLYLVVGDFNDLKKSRPLRAFQSKGDKELSRLLPACDRRGETWTHHYAAQDSYDRVDHVLVSPALMERVVSKAGKETRAGQIIDIPEVGAASDHRPVLVRVRMGAALEKTSIP